MEALEVVVAIEGIMLVVNLLTFVVIMYISYLVVIRLTKWRKQTINLLFISILLSILSSMALQVQIIISKLFAMEKLSMSVDYDENKMKMIE